MKIPVLQQTDDWVVVAKPSGLAVHRSEMCHDRRPVLQQLRHKLGRKVWAAHRLDRATSGCLIFAFDGPTCGVIQGAMRQEQAEKTYIALVRGDMIGRQIATTVDRPLSIDGVIKSALTHFEPIASSTEPRCSLTFARPRTGRTHQIRRHVRGLAHPVLGDTTHGDSKLNKWWREEYGLFRLALHCLRVDIPLPDGRRVQATCPLPKGLARVLHRMPWWDEAVAKVPALALPPAQEVPRG